MRLRLKDCPFVPAFPRDVSVRSIAIWSLRDDGLNERQTIRLIKKCGYAHIEARWGVEQALLWLKQQKTKPAKTPRELAAVFQA